MSDKTKAAVCLCVFCSVLSATITWAVMKTDHACTPCAECVSFKAQAVEALRLAERCALSTQILNGDLLGLSIPERAEMSWKLWEIDNPGAKHGGWPITTDAEIDWCGGRCE